MVRGWKREPTRHGLASKGVETTFSQGKVQEFHKSNDERFPPKELFPIDDELRIIEEKQKEERQDDMSYKDRRDVGEALSKVFKLFWWCNSKDRLDYFPFNDVLKTLHKSKLLRRYKSYTKYLQNNFHKLNKPENLTQEEKNALMDSIIDLVHHQKSVWTFRYIDMDKLRRNFEEEYL